MNKIDNQVFGSIWEDIRKALDEMNKKFNIPLKIAIIGFGNSGKSTLFNAIFGEELQETGAQTNLTKEDRKEKRFGTIFTDTRGFGTRLVPVDDIKMALKDQNLIIHCLNGASAISKEDDDLYNFCKESEKHIIVAVTKVDLLKDREIKEYKESIVHVMSSSINPIFISAEQDTNMVQLVERIVELLPDATRDAFIAKQSVDISLKASRSRKTTHVVAISAAAVAIAPIPVADVAVLIPMQAGLVSRIGKIFGYEITIERAKELLVVAGGGILLRYAYQVLVKFVPVVGSFIGPVIAYGGTVAIGETAIAYFKSGMKISEEEIGEIYQQARRKAKEEFKKGKFSQKMKSKENEIKNIKKRFEKGEITQEQFEQYTKKLMG